MAFPLQILVSITLISLAWSLALLAMESGKDPESQQDVDVFTYLLLDLSLILVLSLQSER